MGKTLGYGEITVANVTEPFTVMLTNEAQQFATDSNRKVTSAQSYYTDIIVIRGSQERTDYTIGNITSGSGITVSKNSKRVTFSVSAGTTIGADAGVIEIPITLDGQTVKKQFSWSCGKQGPQGVKGQDGNSFAWNMLSETNCGKKHWGTESSGGKYSVEDFITEDNIDAVKLICTEAISTSNWSYVSFKDIKMLKQLKPSTKYTLSYDIKANRSGAISHSIRKGDVSNFCTNTVVVNNIIGNETWQHISVVLTTNDLKTTPTNEILYLGRNALSKVGYSIIKNLKLVEGDIDTPWSPSQSDIEGKGVVETVQYYLATSQASGVTSSTSGWSTDITTQKLTADKKYLWNCYQTKYSDGTSEPISTPKVIGVYGDKGQNAKNLSITPSSQYFKSTDGGKTFAPNAITIKPTIQGEINFGKWQYSIDGGVSFADVVSGQKGLTINNNVLTVSKDSSLYSDAITMVTFRAVANDSNFYDTCSIAKIYDVSDIGDGRNLLWNSNFAKTDETINTSTYTTWGLILRGSTYTATIDTSVKHNNFNTLKVIGTKAGDSGGQDLIYRIKGLNLDEVKFTETDVKYTLSFYAKASIACNFSARYAYDSYAKDTNVALSTDWKRYEIQMHPTTTSYQTSLIFKMDAASTVWFSEFKLEKGSSATGYSTAPEDVQVAILSTKSEISDVSLKVDKNKQAIEQRVEKTTYEQDLTLVKGDISKANEGLNKWRYEIYPKSLFTDKPEDQSKYDIGVFLRNKNLTPSRTLVFDDNKWTLLDYENNYIGYGLTFIKMSAKKTFSTKWAHSSSCSIYVNGKLIISDAGTVRLDGSNIGRDFSCTFIEGWNCIEFVMQETTGNEWFFFKDALSQLSECQLMNCYYGTPVARQSHITNQLVQNTTDIEGVTTTMQKVMTTVGGSDRIDEFVNNYNKTIESEKQFKKTIGETYTTKDEFNGLEIGGRNLLTKDDCNMSKWQNLFPAHCKATNNNYSNHIDYVPTGGEWEIIYKKISVTKGQKYILSFDYKVNKAYNYLSGQKYGVYLSTSVPTNATPANIITNGQYVIENTVTSLKRGAITFTAPIDTLYIVINGGCIDDNQTGLSFEFNKWKLEKGNKITDWTPAPEDNEINGQNLVSNLPSNWEQGSFVVEDDSKNKTYSEVKVSEKTQIRIKELIPVFGDITISAQVIQNFSKESLNHYVILFDVNKRYMGKHNVNGWNTSFPRMFNCGDAKYIAIALKWGDGTKTQITPSDISQICLKIERGTSATPFTLAPEDVNGKIVNVETIANQTAKKFEWIVKGESTSSNLVLTDNALTAIANNINLTGKVTFSWLNNETQKKITDANTWVTNNGSSTTSLNSMVKKWTDGAVSDTTQINGGWIKANTITASKIAVGDFTNYADINESNTYGFTVEKTADGVWFSKDGSKLTRDNYISKMYSCEPGQTFYVEYDISNTIKDSTEYKAAGIMLFGCDGTQTVKWYQRRGAVVGTAAGTVTHMSQQLTMPSGTRFFYVVLQIEGFQPFTGTLKIRNLSVRKAVTGAVIVDGSITADKIATDAIKSRNYISSGGTQGSFLNLKDGSFTSPNLSWDANGNLIASNANLSGLINATKGTVGGWNIATNGLYSGIDENAIKIYSATTYDAQTMYQKQKIQDSFILSQKYINHFVSQQVSVGHNIPYWQTRSFIYNDSQIQLAQSDYCINTSSASNYDAQYSLKDGYISATRIYMEQNITQVGGDVINSSFSIGLDSMMGWCSIQSTKGINIYGNSSRALYVQSNDTSKYNALETEGDVVVNGKIHAVSGDNKIQLNSDNNGSIELYGNTPFIDFHSAYSSADYTCRIIANTPEQLLVCGKLRCDSNIISNNDLIANSWVYAGQNAHYTWQNQLDCYFSCGYYNNTNNVYYYAGYHAFYVNGDSGSGMMYIDTSGVSSRKGFRNSSDERIKQNFSHFDDNFIDTYMNLEPVQYQFKNDTNDKYHFGFKAQQTERILNAYGQESDKSYGICATHAINPEKAEKLYGVKDMHEEYTLAYDELIAPTTYMVQHTYKELESTKNELEQVKQEKADLETRLQAIEAKLGL